MTCNSISAICTSIWRRLAASAMSCGSNSSASDESRPASDRRRIFLDDGFLLFFLVLLFVGGLVFLLLGLGEGGAEEKSHNEDRGGAHRKLHVIFCRCGAGCGAWPPGPAPGSSAGPADIA